MERRKSFHEMIQILDITCKRDVRVHRGISPAMEGESETSDQNPAQARAIKRRGERE